MIKRTTVNKENSCVRVGKRGVSVFLAMLLMVSALVITPFVANADNTLTVNYPLLREVGNDGPDGKNWTYSVHDYAEKPSFKTSDTSFLAPKAEITTGGVKLTWSAFSGADNYTINIYDSTNALCFEKSNVSATEFTVPVDELSLGAYQVQLIAFSGNNELAASMVRPFENKQAVSEAELLTNLGGNVQSGGGRFWADEANDSVAIGKAPVSKLHGHTLNRSACFWFNTIGKMPADTQAVAFWYSQKMPDDGSYYALKFQLSWQEPTGLAYSGTANAYFISADNVHTANVVSSGSSAGYTILDLNSKNGDYVEGWVVFPLSNYNDASKTKLLNAANTNLRIYWATEKTLVKADGSINKAATNGDNRRHYVSELHAISDVEAFLDIYKGETDNSYAASAQTDYECDTFSGSGEYYNKNSAENKYVLTSNAAAFTMTDNSIGTKGMSLEFTADKAGYYDLSQKLSVEGNASAKGDVYYRVLRLSDNKTVYPKNEEWKTVAVNGTNPTVGLTAVTAYLAKGDKLRIEAYAKLTSGDKLTINIGNPTVTLSDFINAGTGEYISYKSYDYFLSARDITTPYYINDRFEFYMLDYTSGKTNPKQYNFTKYNKNWSNCLYYNTGTPIIGFWGMGGTDAQKRIKFKAAAGHGPQITYNVSESGYLDIFVPIAMENTSEIDVRVMKNNQQLWPKSGFATVNKCDIRLNTEAQIGDKIKIQFHSNSDTEVGGFTDAVFSHSATAFGNATDSEVYSPLWERPFSYKNNYSGDYFETPASIFSFGYTDGVSIKAMDSFDSKKDNFLYHTDKPESGYNFKKDNITYTATDNTSGMALSFFAPYKGKYDLSTALSVVSGSGNANFEIMVGDTIVWPENGNAYEFFAKPGMTIDIPAIQLDLNSGDTVKYILTSKAGKGAKLVVNIGTPVIYRFANSTYSGSETIDIYTPYKFTAFEKGKVSDRQKVNSRFEYILLSDDGKENTANIYNTAEKSVTLNGTGFKFIETGAVTVDIKNPALTHVIRFTAPRDVTGKLQFGLGGSKNAEIRLTKNGEQIWPENGWESVTDAVVPVELDVSYQKGDKIEWQVKADAEAAVELGVPSITDVYHVTDYNDATVSYQALYGNPFSDKEFSGAYKRYENEAWLYDIADVSDLTAVNYIIPDKYNSQNGKYLYNENTQTGYYFKNTLEAELKNSDSGKYGISLGFKVPRTDAFVFRTGLRIATENATAKLYARLIKNNDVVWCGNSDSGWYSDTAVSGVDVKIPLSELELDKGDIVRLEIYAEEITVDSQNAEKIRVSLVSPELFSESAKEVSDPNIEAKVLYAYEEFPYYSIAYTGKYAPMENRWNYEFATFGENVEKFSPDYYDGKEVDLYSSNVTDAPHYKLKTKTVVLTPASVNAKGINLRYTAAVEAETIFQAVPKITEGKENGNVKFRILSNGKNVWPADNDWEILTSEAGESAIADRLSLNLKAGDNVEIQIFAEPTENTNGNVTVTLDTFAAVVSYKQISKNVYNLKGEQTVPQLDPFWSYEYTIDPENIKWKRASDYGSGYHNIPGAGYNGITPVTAIFGLTTCSGLTDLCEETGGTVPIVAATLNIPRDGFYKMSSDAARIYATGEMTPKIRITVNGEKVWPEDKKWEIVEKPVDSFANMTFELKAGDKLRFEASAAEDYDIFITKDRFRIMWAFGVSYSEWDIIYTETNDIFNMLTPRMHKFYLGLSKKKTVQFDEDYEKHLAESLLPDEPEKLPDTPVEEYVPEINIEPDTQTEGEWIEGTEDQVIVKPGKKVKIIKKIVNNNFVVILIIIISIVAVLLAAATVLLIILHKKGKINWFRKQNKKASRQ